MNEDCCVQTVIRGSRPEMFCKTGVLVTLFKGMPLSECLCLTSSKLVKLETNSLLPPSLKKN